MKSMLGLIVMLVIAASFVLVNGCNKQIGNYVAASSISKGGFAKDRKQMLEANGSEIKTWGFVDHSNIFADGVDGSRQNSTKWRFDLKGKPNDEAGSSFSIYLPKDEGRDKLLEVFTANEKEGKPTRVFVKGKIFTFDAPTNFNRLTGLYMEVESTIDILLDHPDEK